VFRDSSSFSADDYDRDVLASMQNSSWGGELGEGITKTPVLTQVLYIAMMHEAEEEEEQKQ
jgi:hypothetical protein